MRRCLPETNAYQVLAAEHEARFIAGTSNVKNAGLRSWLGAVWADAKRNWVLFIFMIVLMSGFNSCSHGPQDVFPTFLKNRTSPIPKHQGRTPRTFWYRRRTGSHGCHCYIGSRIDQRSHRRHITWSCQHIHRPAPHHDHSYHLQWCPCPSMHPSARHEPGCQRLLEMSKRWDFGRAMSFTTRCTSIRGTAKVVSISR